METSCVVSSDPTMETSGGMVVSDVPMVHRSCFPTNFKVSCCGLGGIMVENAKVNISKLYLRQIFAGCGANQSDVIEPNAVTGLGHETTADCAFRFKGSTLQVMGANDGDEENEWAIVGGTGEFAMARGIINTRVHCYIGNTITQELTIEFFCRMKKEVIVCPPTEIAPPTEIHAPIKQGPWGGMTGGSLHEMEGKSRRLESVTIYHHGVVEGLQFSYVDEDGQIRTTETWGVNRGLFTNEIKFGPSEFVKQITGAGTLGSWLTQFKIVTNTNTYGPFGTIPSQPFSYTVPENSTVVGFFAETLNVFVTRIGVYTIPK